MPGLTMLGAAAGVGTGAFGMGLGHHYYNRRAEKEYRYNRKLARYGRDLDYEMWQKTNYPAQVEMLKAAGLNPALMYGMSGGGGTTTGGVSAGNVTGGSGVGFNPMDMSNLMKMKSEVDLNEALSEKAKAEAAAVGGKLQPQIDEINANIKLLQEQATESGTKQALNEILTRLNRIEAEYRPKVIEKQLEQIGHENKKLYLENKLTEEAWKDLLLQESGKAIQIYNQSALLDAQTKLTETEEQLAWEKMDVLYNELEIKGYLADAQITTAEANELRSKVEDTMRPLELSQRKWEMVVRMVTSIIVTLLGGEAITDAAQIGAAARTGG